MIRSGFFNSITDAAGVKDRRYKSEDYCDNLAVVISNGVLRSNSDDFAPSASGMNVNIKAGRGWIKGHWIHSNSVITKTVPTAHVSYGRYDRIVLRYDNTISGRDISVEYLLGTAAINPEKPALTRTDNIYDLCLCDIYVAAGSTTPVITDTRANADLCGWVYSTSGDNSFFTSLDNQFDVWFEEKKDSVTTSTVEVVYTQRSILTAAGTQLQITIPQFDPSRNHKIDVYVNGFMAYNPDDYTINEKVITFTNTLITGTEIFVYVTIAKDGSGIPTVVQDVTELQERVTALENGTISSSYFYYCNGIDDNVKLSQIANTWLNGGTDYGSLKVFVFGTFGVTAANGGTGSSDTPYKWIEVGLSTTTNRKIIFDFSACKQITIPVVAGTSNIIFYGFNAHIIGANIVADQTAANTIIKVFDSTSGIINAENCRFWINSYKDGIIANTGTFTNCRASVANAINATYCFSTADTGLIRIYGGEYYAYVGNNSYKSAILGQSSTNGVSILYGVNAPTVARSGFYQTESIFQQSASGIVNCTDLISTLPVTVISGISDIRGTIQINKPGLM